MKPSLPELINELPQIGLVDWLGIRPARKAAMLTPDSVVLEAGRGIIGDRYNGGSGNRQVTLIQSEHLAVIASFLRKDRLDPALLRRNIAVSGINLLALKNQRFRIGGTLLEYTGLCHPCSALAVRFGPGGYNAVRGHGGITARIIAGGVVRVGDSVCISQSEG